MYILVLLFVLLLFKNTTTQATCTRWYSSS